MHIVRTEVTAEGFVVKVATGGAAGEAPGSSVEVRFSCRDGALSIWHSQRSSGNCSSDALVADLKPCFYRAPTDNDRGGSGGSSYASRWFSAE